jgi:hypothetical protein
LVSRHTKFNQSKQGTGAGVRHLNFTRREAQNNSCKHALSRSDEDNPFSIFRARDCLLLDARDDDDMYLIAYMMLPMSMLMMRLLPLSMNTNLLINLFEMAMRKLKQSKLATLKQPGKNGIK